jgi:hypothetical protein
MTSAFNKILNEIFPDDLVNYVISEYLITSKEDSREKMDRVIRSIPLKLESPLKLEIHRVYYGLGYYEILNGMANLKFSN